MPKYKTKLYLENEARMQEALVQGSHGAGVTVGTSRVKKGNS